MKDTTGIRLTKEQKRQKPDAKQYGKLMQSDNIALREAGKKLQKLKPNDSISNSNAYNVLLKMLKAGELSAGFFVTSDPESWIEIQSDYWRHIGADRFKSILMNKNGSGTFRIKPREFAEQISGVLVKMANASPDNAARALTSFMNATTSGYEPEIPFVVWREFLEKSGAFDPAAKTTKRGSGAPENPKWSEFAAHVLGYCISQKVHVGTTRKGMHARVLELAGTSGVDTGGWPGNSSSRDFLKEAWTFAKYLQDQHKT